MLVSVLGFSSLCASATDPIDNLFGIAQPGLPSPEGIDEYVIARARDFNKDGLTDYLCFKVSLTRFTVWITFTNPNGTYTQSTPHLLEGSSFFEVFTVAAADIDGDNEPEIIAREGDYSGYTIIETDGSKQIIDIPNMGGLDFGSNDSYAPIVEHGDFDNDGIEDLAFTTRFGRLHVRWSSLPEESRHTIINIDELFDSSMLYRPADYNNDGYIDLLLHLEETQQLMLLPGLGQIGFGSPIAISSIPQTLATSEIPIPCQLDSDPFYDFVQRGPGENDITVYYNALGNSPTQETSSFNEPLVPIEVVQDLDGSGHMELVVARSEPLPTNPYDTALQIVFDYGMPSSRLHPRELGWSVKGTATYANEFFPVPRIALIDTNQDGNPEVLHIGRDDRQVVSVNPMPDRSEHYIGSDPFYLDWVPVHVLPANIDDDDALELIVSTTDGLVSVDPESGHIESYPEFEYVFLTELADLEGDGAPELIVVSLLTGRFSIVRIVGDGTLELIDTYIFEGESRLNSVEVADFNADGRDDLVVLLSDQRRIHIYAGEVGPALSTLSQITGLPGSLNFKPAALDFNNDSLIDFAVGDLTSRVIRMFAGDGTGQFMETHAISSDYPYWITPADVNGDGYTDLVVASNPSYSVTHYLNEDGEPIGDEIFNINGANEAVVMDVDDDGDQDIIFSQVDNFGLQSYILLQNEEGIFSDIPRPFNNTRLTGVNVADVDNDGSMDLMCTSSDDKSVRIHYGIPNAPPCPPDLNNDGELNFFDVNAFLTQQPDYNNDGVFNFFDVPAFLVDFSAGCP